MLILPCLLRQFLTSDHVRFLLKCPDVDELADHSDIYVNVFKLSVLM